MKCDVCSYEEVIRVAVAKAAGWTRKWVRREDGVTAQFDRCPSCQEDDDAFAHCPHCPYCQAEAPILMAHVKRATHWSCRSRECRARWRLEVARTPLFYSEPLPFADDDRIVDAPCFWLFDELRQT